MSRPIAHYVAGRRTKYVVLLFWIVVVAVAAPLAGKLTGVEKNEAKSWLPGKAESTQTLDLQASFASENALPAVIVYERTAGLSPDDRTKIAADAGRLPTVAGVVGKVVGPIFSPDGQAAQLVATIDLGRNGWQKAPETVQKLRDIASSGPSAPAVYVTGPAGGAADSADAFAGIDSKLLFSTLAVVIVILLLTYRSPALWLLPVISAGVALMVAEAVIYLLAAHAGVTVNAQSAGILIVLVFGAGTDYALLLVARYREELRKHPDRHEAMAVALHRAGPAVIASASTVVIGLLCLVVAETNSTKGLGPVAAIGVAVGLLAMLTLLPALLVLVGRWMFWPVRPHHGSAEPTAAGVWARIGRRIARRPRTVWVVTALILGVFSLGMIQLDARGLTNAESFRGTPSSVVGEAALARHFPAGAGSPVVVIGNQAAAGPLRSAFAATPGVASVTPPAARNGKVYLEGTLQATPDSSAAYAVVDQVRAIVHAVPGGDAKVGGNSAINLDVQRAARHDRNLIIPLVLVVVLAILAMLLRAVVAPLILVATVVLSFGAALGLSALVFTHVLDYAGADTSFPLFVFVFLVALGIDYNIFLMTRVREEAARQGTRPGALTALAATGGVITSAGVVLAGTFAVLATLPLTAFAEIGFAVACGVLLDTIVVRSVLVTALTLDVGSRMWWPSTLDRRGEASPAPALRRPVGAPPVGQPRDER